VEVAAALGVSRPTVSEWESGIKVPSRENARGLAMFYRVSLDWLVSGVADPISAENPEEEKVIQALRQAPENIREAVLALLKPYAADNKPPPPRRAEG
jgi:transcriptional regulator with XRE-family HTH domain